MKAGRGGGESQSEGGVALVCTPLLLRLEVPGAVGGLQDSVCHAKCGFAAADSKKENLKVQRPHRTPAGMCTTHSVEKDEWT